MTRGVGASEALREAVAGLEPLFALLTQLGDVWFLTTVSLVVFWLGPAVPLGDWERRKGLVLIGAALCGFAATGALKALFELPRPVGATTVASESGVIAEVLASAATASGYGFPSGHAISATAVYGTAALLATRGRRRQRLAVAAILVTVVGFSRVALGVHFVLDVLVGTVVGGLIAGFAAVLAERPRGLLEVALLFALGWVAAAGLVGDPLTLLGFGAGLWVAWWRYGATVVGLPAAPRQMAVTALAGVALLGPTMAYAATVATGLTAAGMAFAGGLGVVALPIALEKE
ncbi:phosphatase PAP2 family protein [Halobacteriales archaeon Cl-PHB]